MLCFVRNSFLTAWLVAGAYAQSVAPPPSVPAPVPETGFVSSTKYTNAFFGFSMPLPKDPSLRELALPHSPSHHFLFGLQAQTPDGLSTIAILANDSAGASADEARKTAAGPKGESVRSIEIGGKKFWKSESEQKSLAGRMRNRSYAFASNGYILEFMIISFDVKVADELQHSVEAVSFFDPAKAAEIAGSDSNPYHPGELRGSSGAVPPSSSRIAQLNPGTISGDIYANEQLGLSYIFPEGWVVNDKAALDKTIEIGHQVAWGDDPSAAREHEQFLRCTRPLLFVTQHPPRTRSDVDSLIFVLASDPACTPGIHFPTSIDDRDTIKQVAVQIIRSFSGTPFLPKGKPSVNAFEIQGRVMLDIYGSFEFKPAKANTQLKAWSALDLTESGGYWVLWFFLSGSEAGLQELRETKIKFTSPPTVPQAQ
jgi:hypothetical protein